MVRGRARVGRARLRPRDQPARGRGPDAGLGVDGHGPGARARRRSTTRACRCARTCSTTACRRSSSRRRSRPSSSRRPIRTARSARRRRAKGRCPDSCRRSPTRSPTRSACGSTSCRRRPTALLDALAARAARTRAQRVEGRARERARRDGAPRRRSRCTGPPTLAEAVALLAARPARARDRRRHRPRAQPARRPGRAARCWSTSPRSRARRDRVRRRDGATLGRRRHARAARRDRGARRGAAGAARGRGERRRPGASHRRRRSAATCASTRAACSTTRASGGARANDYCLKHGGDTCHVAPQGNALPRGLRGRPRAGADRARRARSRSPARPGRAGCRSTHLYVDDGAAPPRARAGELVAASTCPAQPPRRAQRLPQGPRARRDRFSARRRRRARALRDGSRVAPAGRADRHQLAPVPARGHRRLRRRRASTSALLAALGEAGAEAGGADAHDGSRQSNWRRRSPRCSPGGSSRSSLRARGRPGPTPPRRGRGARRRLAKPRLIRVKGSAAGGRV